MNYWKAIFLTEKTGGAVRPPAGGRRNHRPEEAGDHRLWRSREAGAPQHGGPEGHGAKTRELVDGCEREGRPLAAIDAIALLESGLKELCHATVAVIAPPEVRVRRIMAREGISEDYARARVRAQKPDDYFIKGCDYTLWNDCAGPEEFGARVRALLGKLFADKEV